MKIKKRLSAKKVKVLMLTLSLLSSASIITLPKRRRYGVRPLNRLRQTCGHFDNLVKFMIEEDHDQFFKYTRMTPDLFKHLLSLLEHRLKKKSKKALSPGQRLVMTLHFLSEGCSMQEIAWNYYVGLSTVHYIIKETTTALWDVLAPIYLPEPNEEQFLKVAKGFFNKWQLPNCIGAVDGKHVTIRAPKFSGSDYFNYKKCFSLVLMASCDAFYKFIMVDIGAAGSNHDSFVFRKSAFGERLMNRELPIPKAKALPGTNIIFPHFLSADAAFPLHENIMKPYPGHYLGETKNIYNYRLTRGRRTIENAFGIMCQRWRQLLKPIVANVETCENITKACVVLHNFLQTAEEDLPENERAYCPSGYADFIDVTGNLHTGRWREEAASIKSIRKIGSNFSGRNARDNRDKLAEYFISLQGSMPRQYEYVDKGRNPIV